MFKMIPMLISIQMMMSKTHMTILIMAIITSILMSCNMFLMTLNYWMSFMIIFIFISGIMVLFMYVISLSPMEKTPVKMMKNLVMIIIAMEVFSKSETSKLLISKMKMSTMYKTNLSMVAFMLTLITIMSMIPPKMMIMAFKGMKTSK